ncbi:MAG TPA: hypothetical protein VFD70_25485 [Anaerolineae bacterium]|nr:hypothetical protein [Anaerolineae bacterium]
MENIISLLCLAGFVLIALAAFLAMSGLFRRAQGAGSPYSTVGNEYPRYDDPHVSSGGSFGSPSAPTGSGGVFMPRSGGGGERPRFDDPHVRSGGSFG